MQSMQPRTRATLSALLLFAIALTGWFMVDRAADYAGQPPRDTARNPGFQHAMRLQVATARAAADALGIQAASSAAAAAPFRADYQVQQLQIQADSLGLDRWAAQDTRRQGLLLTIRDNLAVYITALRQTDGSATAAAGAPATSLLPALDQVERALSNYAASLSQPAPPSRTLLFSVPAGLWLLFLLLLLEVAALAWLVLPA
jgi:hypothetical protein